MIALNLFLVVILIIATAFFVAAEFAVVKLRPSRIEQLIVDGNKKALNVQRVISNLDGYLSACQLGITITALGLGMLGEPTVEMMLHPVFHDLGYTDELSTLISIMIAFAVITFLHVVIGELAPKTLAIQKAEKVSLFLAGPLILFYKIMYPFIWVLNGSAGQLIKLLGMKPAKEHEEAHSEEELRIILSESYQRGEINQAEYGYVNRIFAFDDLLAREIMIPRTDMVCLFEDQSLEENLKIIKREQYTRFPVAIDDKDNIVGMLNTKEFFLKYSDDPNLELSSLVRPTLSYSESTPIKKLLKEMQKHGVHFVIVVDEYGGTAGLVTIEDILEEIVGEIRDEFDTEERSDIEKIDVSHYIVQGKVSINEINSLLKLNLDTEEYDTIGGWLYGQNYLLKEEGKLQIDGYTFIVKKKDKHRIRKIEIKKNIEEGIV